MSAYPSQLQQFVAGCWYRPASGDVHVVSDPATGALIGEVAFSGPDDLEAALAAAAAGFAASRCAASESRAQMLDVAACLLRDRPELIATLATTEQGKPIAESRGEVSYAARLAECYAGEALRIYGRVLAITPDRRSLVAKEPVGPVYLPTVLVEMRDAADIMSEESFGWVAAIRSFAAIEEVIHEANRLPFGLAAYCFTNDLRTATMLGNLLEAGMACINDLVASHLHAPFGGVKETGHGSEDGPEGSDAFLTTKAIHQC